MSKHILFILESPLSLKFLLSMIGTIQTPKANQIVMIYDNTCIKYQHPGSHQTLSTSDPTSYMYLWNRHHPLRPRSPHASSSFFSLHYWHKLFFLTPIHFTNHYHNFSKLQGMCLLQFNTPHHHVSKTQILNYNKTGCVLLDFAKLITVQGYEF